MRNLLLALAATGMLVIGVPERAVAQPPLVRLECSWDGGTRTMFGQAAALGAMVSACRSMPGGRVAGVQVLR